MVIKALIFWVFFFSAFFVVAVGFLFVCFDFVLFCFTGIILLSISTNVPREEREYSLMDTWYRR